MIYTNRRDKQKHYNHFNKFQTKKKRVAFKRLCWLAITLGMQFSATQQTALSELTNKERQPTKIETQQNVHSKAQNYKHASMKRIKMCAHAA